MVCSEAIFALERQAGEPGQHRFRARADEPAIVGCRRHGVRLGPALDAEVEQVYIRKNAPREAAR